MSVRYVPEARVWVVTYEPIKGCPFTYVTWIKPVWA